MESLGPTQLSMNDNVKDIPITPTTTHSSTSRPIGSTVVADGPSSPAGIANSIVLSYAQFTTAERKSFHSTKRKEVAPKFCEHCGNVIPRRTYTRGRQATTAYNKTRFCSHNCASRHKQINVPIEGRLCKYRKCSKVLVRKHHKNNSHSGWQQIESIECFNLREYCEPVCYQLDRRRNKSDRNKWGHCWHCNSVLERKEDERLSDWQNRKFCDYDGCFRLFKLDHEGHIKSALKSNPCKVCGKGTRQPNYEPEEYVVYG